MSDLPKHQLKKFFGILKRLFSIAPPRRSLIAASILCIALSSIFQMFGLGLVVPVLNGLAERNQFAGIEHAPILGDLIKAWRLNDWQIFLFLMGLIFVSAALENLCMLLGQIFSARISTNAMHNLRLAAFDRYLLFSKTFYDRHKSGELGTLVVTVVTQMGGLIEQLARMLILISFATVFFLLMLIISWQLTVVAAILLPITHLLSRSIGAKIQRSAKEELGELLNLSNHTQDVLANMQLVHLSGAETIEHIRFEKISREVLRHGFNVRRKRYAAPRIVDIVDSLGVVIVVCLSVFLYFSTGAESPGRFFVYFLSLRRFTSHLEQLTAVWSLCLEWSAYAERFLWIFDNEDKHFIPDGSKICSGVKEHITYKNVSFSYDPESPVLHDLSFEAKRGSIIALVGATGAGKTTLLSLLPRFYDQSAGSIEIDGIDIREFQLKSLRSKIALVSQDALIFNDSILNNITYGLGKDITIQQVESVLHAAHLHEFVMKLPKTMHTEVGTKGVRLSGGEKQRLSIARAILRNPEILILDEATSALDSETELRIQLALESLFKGRTVFVIAHRLSTVAKADLVLVLESGRIIERGSPDELLERKGRFFEYWEIQQGAMRQ